MICRLQNQCPGKKEFTSSATALRSSTWRLSRSLHSERNLFSYRCGDTSIPPSVETVWLLFSKQLREIDWTTEGVERYDGRCRRHIASGLLIWRPVFTGLIDESQTQTEPQQQKPHRVCNKLWLFSQLFFVKIFLLFAVSVFFYSLKNNWSLKVFFSLRSCTVFLTQSDSIWPLDMFRHQNLSIHSVHSSLFNLGLIPPVGPVHKPAETCEEKLKK